MDQLRKLAFLSVARACGFAGLAILCVMVGMSYDPVAAAKAGGILTLMVTAVLMIKARAALSQDHRRTELWIMLDKADRPPDAVAQWASATVLRDAYLWFAQFSAGMAALFWLIAFLLSLAGIDRAG